MNDRARGLRRSLVVASHGVVLLAAMLVCAQAAAADAPTVKLSFNRDIRPIQRGETMPLTFQCPHQDLGINRVADAAQINDGHTLRGMQTLCVKIF